MSQTAPVLTVGLGGLGAIGSIVAKALDEGIPGLSLRAVASRNAAKAAATLSSFRRAPEVTLLSSLAELVDVVVECAPAGVFDEVARPAIERGRTLVVLSSGALLAHARLFDLARQTGAKIIVPSGGIAGLDGLLALRERDIRAVRLVTRKPPNSFRNNSYLEERGLALDRLSKPLKIFDGYAQQAAAAFPANANVAATLSLAGIGPERTQVEIWADPTVSGLVQELHVEAAAGQFRLRLESQPLPDNPRSGSFTPLSVIAALRSLVSSTRIGT